MSILLDNQFPYKNVQFGIQGDDSNGSRSSIIAEVTVIAKVEIAVVADVSVVGNCSCSRCCIGCSGRSHLWVKILNPSAHLSASSKIVKLLTVGDIPLRQCDSTYRRWRQLYYKEWSLWSLVAHYTKKDLHASKLKKMTHMWSA